MRLTGIVAVVALLSLDGLAQTAQTTSPRITPDVVYGHKDGMAMTFDVYTPPNPNGAGVLFMVSGGWVSTWAPPESAVRRFEPLTNKGFTVFSVRHGSSPRYKVPEAAADVDRALRFIKTNSATFGVDANRLGAYGGSAGGHLSLLLGLDADPAGLAAVVALFPPVDLRGWTGVNRDFPALDFAADQAASVSPILLASKDDPPTLLIHGDQDKLVPISHSQRMYAALKEAGVTSEFVTIEGGGHGFTGANSQRATELLVAWFERHLLKK